MATLRIGTRSSPLARWQAQHVRQLLAAAHPQLQTELVDVTTTGDTDMRPLREIDSRGVFAAELEQALLDGRVDIAVHSAKDLRLDGTPGLQLVAFLARQDPRDVICGAATSIAQLPAGARVATSSARRRLVLGDLRDDLQVVDIRGNVQTRLRRSRELGYDGCMLAAAGIVRLGLREQVGIWLDVAESVPEAGQGCVVVQARDGHADESVTGIVDWSRVDDMQTRFAVTVEREVARQLGGGCEVPLGVHLAPPATAGAPWRGHLLAPGAGGAVRRQCEIAPGGGVERAVEVVAALAADVAGAA